MVLPQKDRGCSDLSWGLKQLCFGHKQNKTKKLKFLAKTVLGDYGRFHSFLLVTIDANTIETEMTRLVKSHRFQEGSRRRKGSGCCGQTSRLEMFLGILKAFQIRSEPSEFLLCCWFIGSLILFILV